VNSAYKPLLYLNDFARISRILQQPSQNPDGVISNALSGDATTLTEETVSSVRWNPKNKNYPISPLQYTVDDVNFHLDVDNEVEIFEVNLLGNKVFPPRQLRDVKHENSLTTVDSLRLFNNIEDNNIREFLQQFCLSAQGYDQEIKMLECKSKQLSVEPDFMANYFAQAWGFPVAENQSLEEILQIAMEQKRKAGFLPLVCFNVEGEIVPILRSTILRVIPQSQLAIRVSGRWTDQPSDIDEHGNLIVRCPKEAFKHILASIQVHNPTREEDFPLEIFVNEYSKHTVEETLDFLQITPHFIRFLDCEF
jgi:hypothetical protein